MRNRTKAKALAALECVALDAAELAQNFERAAGALLGFDAHLRCLALDQLEMDPPFDDGDVRGA